MSSGSICSALSHSLSLFLSLFLSLSLSLSLSYPSVCRVTLAKLVLLGKPRPVAIFWRSKTELKLVFVNRKLSGCGMMPEEESGAAQAGGGV